MRSVGTEATASARAAEGPAHITGESVVGLLSEPVGGPIWQVTMPKKIKATKRSRQKPSVDTNRNYIVCDKCGTHCAPGSRLCSCGGQRFAPSFVRELRRINRFASVRVNNPHPESQNQDPVIALYKWWPGGKANFNILTPTQWEAIKQIIDHELGPVLGWVPSQVAKTRMEQSIGTEDLTQLSKQYPERFAKLVAALKLHIEMPSGEENEQLYTAIADLISQFDKASIARVTRIVNAMKDESAGNIKALDEVLSDWSLSQVTSVLRETRRRLAMIDLLRESLRNERTFEIRGDNSIHSILEQDLWLLDESYWMLQSNKTLKTFIGDKLSEKDALRYGKKRPDFACGNLGSELVLVELKRPSHELTKDDLNQLEEYLAMSEKYSTRYRSYKAYLMGSSISDEVRTYLRYRRGFNVLNYWEVLDATQKRYGEFLQYREKTLPKPS